MKEIIEKEFEFETINIDNKNFIKCVFTSCKLVYSGEGSVGLNGCTFNNCRWGFTGSASNTISFLKGMYHGMGEEGKKILDRTIEDIKASN